MPNALGTLNAAIITQIALESLKTKILPISRLVTDFRSTGAKFNQDVTTRIPGVGAVYDASSGYTAPFTADVDATVTLDNHKAASMKFTSSELSSTNRNLAAEHIDDATNKLAAEATLALLTLLNTAATFTNGQVLADASHNDDGLRSIRKNMVIRNGQMGTNPTGLINATAYETLTGDDVVIETAGGGDGTNRTGMLSTIKRGFEIWEVPQFPTASNGLGVYLEQGAVCGVFNVPTDANQAGFADDVPNVAKVDVEVDPEGTGLALMHRSHKTANGDFQVDLTWMYGFAAGDVSRAQRITSA